MQISELPKVHLHVHFVGSVSPDTVRGLVQGRGGDFAVLPYGEQVFPPRFPNFLDFVKTYLAVSSLVSAPDDVFAIAKAFASEQKHQNVRWAEVTVTARTLVNAGIEPKPLWDAIVSGFAEVDGIDVGVIVDTIRDDGAAAVRETLEIIDAGDDVPLVGLGLTGVEGSVDEDEFTMLRSEADDRGVGVAVHAGEAGDSDRIRRALDTLGADRIGHGIAAVQDTELLQRLAAEQTPIEVCPSSNVALQFVESLDVHPLPAMVDAGLNVSINADDPHFFNSPLTGEIEHAARLCDWDATAMIDSQLRANAASFAPAAIKTAIADELNAYAADPEGA